MTIKFLHFHTINSETIPNETEFDFDTDGTADNVMALVCKSINEGACLYNKKTRMIIPPEFLQSAALIEIKEEEEI